nr:hypothetical protein [Escherichia coli]
MISKGNQTRGQAESTEGKCLAIISLILSISSSLLKVMCKRLVRTVLIFTESSDQLSRATDRVPGLPASPGYV